MKMLQEGFGQITHPLFTPPKESGAKYSKALMEGYEGVTKQLILQFLHLKPVCISASESLIPFGK
jgi:hypothetical protein